MEIFLLPIGLLKKIPPKWCAQAGLQLFWHIRLSIIKCLVRSLFGDRFVGKQDGLRKCKPSSTELGDRIKRLSTLNLG
jgi:hypothetical protein